MQRVPAHRQNEIQTLRQKLTECQQNKIDSVEFRIEMIDYVSRIPAGLLAFIPRFDSRLRKKLQTVLTDPRFSEQQLSLKERKQDRTIYSAEIDRLNTNINLLTQQLAEEQAKDNVQKVNQLTRELELEKQKNAFLTTENKGLETGFNQVNQQFASLQNDYDALQTKYNALLEEKKSSADQNAKPASIYSPLFM